MAQVAARGLDRARLGRRHTEVFAEAVSDVVG